MAHLHVSPILYKASAHLPNAKLDSLVNELLYNYIIMAH